MQRFLKETWELWYWAMFCPSKLKKRIDQQSLLAIKNSSFLRLSLGSITSSKILLQFLICTIAYSIPLLLSVVLYPTPFAWIFLLVAFISAYGVAISFPPVGITFGMHIPIISFITYIANPNLATKNLFSSLQEVDIGVSSITTIFLSVALISIGLSLTSAVAYGLFKTNLVALAQITSVVGSSAVVFISVLFISQSLSYALLVGGILAILLYLYREDIDSTEDSFNVVLGILIGATVSIITSVVIATLLLGFPSIVLLFLGVLESRFAVDSAPIITSVSLFASCSAALIASITAKEPRGKDVVALIAVTVATIVAFGTTTIVAAGTITYAISLAALPLPMFLSLVSIVSFSFSYRYQRLLGIWIGLIFAVLGINNLGGLALLSLPVATIFYYRILPEYIFLIPISINHTFIFLKWIYPDALTIKTDERRLKRLPPFSSELLFLPLPNHENLLARVFQLNPTLGLKALQQMQTSPLPGENHTANIALPLIISDYLASFEDSHNFRQLISDTESESSNKLLKTLIPTFFIPTEESFYQSHASSNLELSIILPLLKDIAQSTDAALQSNNFALRERGLEKVVTSLKTLPFQLPGLGLTNKAIQRWTTVIQRWQRIVEYDLSEQKILSQGELLNPFQYGNPLRRNRTDLFKGRQTFAENIARILLDRNRPTIILHGPRRCGKTSFLYNLPRLLPSQWVPIFVDAQSSATTTDEAGFCEALVRAIIRDGQSQGIKFPTRPDRSKFLSAPYVTLENWLTGALDKLAEKDPEKRLLLTIDEFEKIGSAMDEGKFTIALFNELRSLIQHWDQLGFIFSGIQTLEELGPNWSSYFISVIPVEMLYLQPHEAKDLLTNPDPEFSLTYAPGIIANILTLTQCHPNLLQLIGAALVTEANERYTTTATAEMLQAAIPRAFTLGTSYFTNVWTEFTGNPRHPAEVQQGQMLLKALAEGHQPDPDADNLTKSALRRMERYHILKRVDNQYAFDIPLIQRWVQERAILND